MRRLRTVLVVITLVWPTLTFAAGEPRTLGGPKVRPYDGRSATLLLEGLRRSDTLRAIVDELESRDVIVYIEMNRLLRKGLAGKMAWMTTTPLFRYVRISLNPELTGPVAVGALGHELQHALEVANEPSVVDDQSLENFYRSTGISMLAQPNGWDTRAAREVGDEVRREASVGGALQLAARVDAIDPLVWAAEYRQARESMR